MLLKLPNDSQCLRCKRFRRVSVNEDETKESYHCEAFAKIPDVILTNGHDHKHPFRGDGGVLFEPKGQRNGRDKESIR